MNDMSKSRGRGLVACAATVGLTFAALSASAAPMRDDPALLAALKTAEAAGGTVLEIRRDGTGARPAYQARILQDGTVSTAVIDPVIDPSGGVSALGGATPPTRLSAEERRDVGTVPKARIAMEDAIRTAEKTEELAAVSAQFRVTRGGLLTYDVAMAGGGGEHHVFVDATNGEVIEDSNLLANAF